MADIARLKGDAGRYIKTGSSVDEEEEGIVISSG